MNVRLISLAALSSVLLLTPGLLQAEEIANIAPQDSFSIGAMKANPRESTAPIDVVKPPTIVRTEDYALIFESNPATIQVAETFTISIVLKTSDQSEILPMEPGSMPRLVLLQRRGHCGLSAPIVLNANGGATLDHLAVPYSGGYEAFIRFQPVGQAWVTERIPLFVEGVAENGRDITGRPRQNSNWKMLPLFTREVNTRVVAASRQRTLINQEADLLWGSLTLVDDDPRALLLSATEPPACITDPNSITLVVQPTT